MESLKRQRQGVKDVGKCSNMTNEVTDEEWKEFLKFMEQYEKSKENSILFKIYEKIKNFKKGKE